MGFYTGIWGGGIRSLWIISPKSLKCILKKNTKKNFQRLLKLKIAAVKLNRPAEQEERDTRAHPAVTSL